MTFAGIGGIDLGFEQAGFEIAWANEIDIDACKTYKLNFPKTKLYECDIRELNAYNLPETDVLTAEFPCQPFSVCGKQNGFKDDRGNLFFEIMRIVDAKQPKIIFLENVANLVEHDNGRTFNVIHNELAEREYIIIRYIVADACNYGVPQHRTRTYIVAFKDETAAMRFAFPEFVELTSKITDVIDRSTKADDRYYLSVDSNGYKKLSGFVKDEQQLYRFSDYGIQISKDGICFTLKANMGTWYNRVPYIKDYFGIRTITPLEYLALQGFPKSFRFPNYVSLKSTYKQCGNSVVVPVITRIAIEIKKVLYTESSS